MQSACREQLMDHLLPAPRYSGRIRLYDFDIQRVGCLLGKCRAKLCTSTLNHHLPGPAGPFAGAFMSLRKLSILAVVAAFSVVAIRAADPPKQTTWNFDSLTKIGGLPVKVEGHPKLIDSPVGKAVEFDGVGDSLFIDKH